MIVPIAHAGHWLSSLIYVVPVAVLVGLLLLDRVRNRGRDPEGEVSGDGGPGEITMRLREALLEIQTGRAEDAHGWMRTLVPAP